MQDIWTYLKGAEKPVVIYGMGDGCDKIIAVCKEKGVPVSGIFASDEYVRDKTVHGFKLTTYAEAKEKFGDMIVLLAFGVCRQDLMEKIINLSKKEELYAPEVPLFGGGLFDTAYYEENREKLDEVENMLSFVHNELVNRARVNLAEKTHEATTYEEFLDVAENKPGFIKAMWCGDRACEDKLKEEAGVTSRCIPFEQEQISDVCPVCGNVLHSMGEAAISCHGVMLTPAQAEETDEHHMIFIEGVEDEYFVRIDHEMTKNHYISFVSYVTCDRVQTIKFYPEGNPETRINPRGSGYLYFYCNKHGLMRKKI